MVNPSTVRDTFLALETFEKGLNIAGYFPVIGELSASLRNFYAQLEIITGVAISIFSLAIHLRGNPSGIPSLVFGATLLGHGILNEIRVDFEKRPFLPWVTLLPYDLFATLYLGRRLFSYT